MEKVSGSPQMAGLSPYTPFPMRMKAIGSGGPVVGHRFGFCIRAPIHVDMDRKSTAMVVAVVIAVAAASYLAMEMDDTWDVGSEEDGYKVTLKLALQEGLRCTVGDRVYHNGDSIVFYYPTSNAKIALHS